MHRYDKAEEQPALVGKAVDQLLKQGFTHEDIVILTCRGVGNSVFSDLDKTGQHVISKFAGDYDAFGSQIWTEGKLRFDSVYRFKGQQAAAIILVDVDPSSKENRIERDQQILFCGMTRATVRLELVMQKDNKLNWKMSG